MIASIARGLDLVVRGEQLKSIGVPGEHGIEEARPGRDKRQHCGAGAGRGPVVVRGCGLLVADQVGENACALSGSSEGVEFEPQRYGAFGAPSVTKQG